MRGTNLAKNNDKCSSIAETSLSRPLSLMDFLLDLVILLCHYCVLGSLSVSEYDSLSVIIYLHYMLLLLFGNQSHDAANALSRQFTH